MKYLVDCTCGHSLELHGADGCAGEHTAACACKLDQIGALNAAIDGARADATAGWRRPDEASAEIA